MYDVKVDHCTKDMGTKYAKLFLLDSDPEVFDKLIDMDPPLSIADIGNTDSRDKNALLSFTTNLNPAVRHSIERICAHRESQERVMKAEKYLRRSIFESSRDGGQSPPTRKIRVEEHNASIAGYDENNDDNIVMRDSPQKRNKHGVVDGAADVGAGTGVGVVTMASQGGLKDSLHGQDLIGYKTYARVLAELILFSLQDTPFVIGLFASWGQGKSFIMNKVKAQIYYGDILQRLHDVYERQTKESWEASCGSQFKGKMRPIHRENMKKNVEALNRWLQEDKEEELERIWARMQKDGAVEERLFSDNNINLEKLLDEFHARERDMYQWDYWAEFWGVIAFVLCAIWSVMIFPFRLAWSCVSGFVSFCRTKTTFSTSARKTFRTRSTREGRKIFVKKTIDPPLRMMEEEDHHEHEDQAHKNTSRDRRPSSIEKEYEFVHFNAWLYNGTDNLWAAFILLLHKTLQDRYGSTFIDARKRAEFWRFCLSTLMASLVFVISLILLGNNSDHDHAKNRTKIFVNEIVLKSIGFGSGGIVVLNTLVSVWRQNKIQSVVSNMENSISQLTKKLGFMDEVRTQLFRIGRLLEHPLSVDTAWTHFVPQIFWWLPTKTQENIITYFGKYHYANFKPCQFIIFVDDLDRCAPEKCVEIIQAVNLMCEGLPFVIFLAIDPRVVVCSIEAANSNFYDNVGISGYSYLDKIVQLPFSIPAMVTIDKKAMVRGFLTKKSKGSRDYMTIHKWDREIDCQLQTHLLQGPTGVGFQDGKLIATGAFGGLAIYEPDTGECIATQMDFSVFSGFRNAQGPWRANVGAAINVHVVDGGENIFFVDYQKANLHLFTRSANAPSIATASAWTQSQKSNYLEHITSVEFPTNAFLAGVACSKEYVFVSAMQLNCIFVLSHWSSSSSSSNMVRRSSSINSLDSNGNASNCNNTTGPLRLLHKITEPKLNGPTGLCVSDNRLYIADRYNHRVVVLNADTFECVMKLGGEYDSDVILPASSSLLNTSNTPAPPPASLVSPDDYIFEIMNDASKRTNDNPPSKDGLKFLQPNSIAVDPDGNILIYDTGHRRIVVLQVDGVGNNRYKYICSVMEGDFAPLGAFQFACICICPETGRIAVSDDEHERIVLLKPYLYGSS